MSVESENVRSGGESAGSQLRDIWNEYLPAWLASPMVLVMLLITIFPGVYDLYLSFVHYNYVRPEQIGSFAGLANFAFIFSSPETWHSIGITLVFVVGALALETAIGFCLAALVTNVSNDRAREFYRVAFILPMAVAPVSLATIGRIMLNPTIGIVPYLIQTYTPFVPPNFLTDFPLTTVILIDAWNWTPFMFIIFYAGLSSVPEQLIEAARVDGAPVWRRYVHIIIPYMKPVVFVAVLIRLIDLFRTFGTVFSLTRGGPGTATQLVSIQIFDLGFKYVNLGTASALAIVYLVGILVICNVLIRVFDFEGVWN